MQTVLIPSNFNLSALDCIPDLCQQFEKEELNIIFVHLFKLSDSIGELLLLSRRSREFELVDDHFYAGCTEMKQKYPQIKNIRIEFLYGSTLSMFRNFLEANEVDQIMEPGDSFNAKLHKSSIDPVILIQKSGLPILKIIKRPVKLKVVAAVVPVKQEEMMAEA